jgi:hypothetical protein
MKIPHHYVAKCGLHFLVALAIAASPAWAAYPEYTFRTVEDHQPDLCAHMNGVFNQHFRHMWSEAVLTDPLDLEAMYSEKSAYAFPLLAGTKHDMRATMAMRFTKVPSSPEFDEIQWYEGHGKETPISASGKNLAYVPPYLVAYVDIDNDGVIDTVFKPEFTIGYSMLLFKAGTAGGAGESIWTYRDKRIEVLAPNSFWDLKDNSDMSHGPLITIGDQLRLFSYLGKTYLATYDQGFFDSPSKRTRAKLKRDVPPHETMNVASLSYTGSIDPTGRPGWSVTKLCKFDMIQTH